MTDTDLRRALPAARRATFATARERLRRSSGQGSGHGAAPAFRPDIEGLRAIAVGLVVLSHAGVAQLAGGYIGVDVFFVISGFLITTLLVKEATRTGTVSLRGFYARRMTRLLPASTLVVLATLVAAWLFAAPTRWASLVGDAVASVAYAVNWRLAVAGTDYLNAAAPPSPLQHLWSLAVEEQFYFVWPLLVLGVWRWRRGKGDQRRALRIALVGIVVVSLAASVWQTATSAPWAYFGAHTRAWELAVGALVALSVNRLGRVDPRLRAGAAWAGLAAIGAAALLFDDQTAFPGWVALLPVLGTAAAIAGGIGGPAGGPGRLLGTYPFQKIGGLSYSWYLWHWPILVIGPAALGYDPVLKVNAVLAAGSLVVAWASYRLLENPVRSLPWLRVRPRRGLGLGLALSGTVAAVALIGSTVPPTLPLGPPAADVTAAVRASSDPAGTLAKAVAASVRDRRIPSNLTPAVTAAADDLPPVYADGCHIAYLQIRPAGPCVYGDPNGTRTLVLIGDSHGAHWFEAFDALAKAHRMRFVPMTKSGCQVPSVAVWNNVLKRRYDECVTWRDQILGKIVADRPAIVVMSSNGSDEGGLLDASGAKVPTAGPGDDEQWVAGWKTSVDRLSASGAKLVLLEDTPWPRGSAPDCLASNPRGIQHCDMPAKKAFRNKARRTMVADAARTWGVTVVDPAPWFCTSKTCPPIVGNVLVYRDHSHISSQYARLLVPVLDPLLPWDAPAG